MRRFLMLDSVFNDGINVFTHPSKILIDCIVWNSEISYAIGFQKLCSFLIISNSRFFIVLGTIQFDHQFRCCTIKISNVTTKNSLPVDMRRITFQKVVP